MYVCWQFSTNHLALYNFCFYCYYETSFFIVKSSSNKSIFNLTFFFHFSTSFSISLYFHSLLFHSKWLPYGSMSNKNVFIFVICFTLKWETLFMLSWSRFGFFFNLICLLLICSLNGMNRLQSECIQFSLGFYFLISFTMKTST